MIITLQVFFVLALLVLLIQFVYKSKRAKKLTHLPDHYKELLNDYVKFYSQLDEEGKKHFEERLQRFFTSVKITEANAIAEDLDKVLIAAGAIIPVYHIPDWEYINLHEVVLYPGTFNQDFDQQGMQRDILGMVGTGAMQNVMIISKWELRQGFINSISTRNVALHEFVHLIDLMDGTLDGVPEILLERKYVPQWLKIVNSTIMQIKTGESDIDFYGATNQVEFFAVVSEYFFEQPRLLKENHREVYEMLEKIFGER
ncbi:MAG TPA: M90 family metallopeptidase, partial [Chitinophagaceae bacterium]|nr:M90 family metallopeptidase [Chitinophagaceae bacterium]